MFFVCLFSPRLVGGEKKTFKRRKPKISEDSRVDLREEKKIICKGSTHRKNSFVEDFSRDLQGEKSRLSKEEDYHLKRVSA